MPNFAVMRVQREVTRDRERQYRKKRMVKEYSRVHGLQYSTVERVDPQRGRRTQFYWESFTETG